MINLNWSKVFNGNTYKMEYIASKENGYFVKFSCILSDDTQRECLVELRSDELSLCERNPEITFDYIYNTQQGLSLILVTFRHNRKQDPDFKNVRTTFKPIIHLLELFDWRKDGSIRHDLDGCVVNPHTCVMKTRAWFESFVYAKKDIGRTEKHYINIIKNWEDENCPKDESVEKEVEEDADRE